MLTLHCAITAENGNRVSLTVDNDKLTPTQLRLQVAETTKIPLAQLRLIFRGRMIKDDTSIDVIKEYKLEHDCVLHCMGKPNKDAVVPAQPAPAAAAAPASAPTISATASTFIPTPPPPAAATAATGAKDPLEEALEHLRTNASSPDVYTTAVTTLDKILTNIIQNPLEEKYRTVKVHNAAFGKRLGNLVGGRQAMLGVGFIQTTDDTGTQTYLMQASADAWPALQKAKTTMERAVAQAKRVSATTTPTPSFLPGAGATGAAPFGGFGGGGGMPSMPAGNPMASAMAQDLMSNPQTLQNMMQNPMVQQMIQNDPNIPPHVRSAMQSLSSNPAMMNQLSQMMSDPAVRSQMQSAMANGGGMPTMGAPTGMTMPTMPNNTANNNNNNNNSATNNNSTGGAGGNDQSQTEEEMIAEAIRRSLEEG